MDLWLTLKHNQIAHEFSSIADEEIELVIPKVSHFEQWHQVRKESQNFLKPFSPAWSKNALSKKEFNNSLSYYYSQIPRQKLLPFFIIRKKDQQILGGITLTNIRFGIIQSTMIGYWMGVRYASKGYMSRALKLICPLAFNQLGLHRIEAAILPQNEQSRHLLINNKFQYEGVARKYFKINGLWQDHLVFARLNED